MLALLLLVAEGVLLRSHSQVRTGKSIDAVIDVLGKMLKDFSDMASEDKENWEKYSKWSADEETDRRSFIQNQEGVVMSATAMLNANKQQVRVFLPVYPKEWTESHEMISRVFCFSTGKYNLVCFGKFTQKSRFIKP